MRSAGLPIEALIEYVKLFREGDDTIPARLEILLEQREILLEKIASINSTLERLDYKIELYRSGKMRECENKLNLK